MLVSRLCTTRCTEPREKHTTSNKLDATQSWWFATCEVGRTISGEMRRWQTQSPDLSGQLYFRRDFLCDAWGFISRANVCAHGRTCLNKNELSRENEHASMRVLDLTCSHGRENTKKSGLHYDIIGSCTSWPRSWTVASVAVEAEAPHTARSPKKRKDKIPVVCFVIFLIAPAPALRRARQSASMVYFGTQQPPARAAIETKNKR